MSDDIYTILLSQGFLKRECDLEEKKQIRKKEKNRLRILKKILYEDDSSGSENYTETVNQIINNSYIDSVVQPKEDKYINYLKNKFDIELNDYFYINDKNLDQMKVGGYIRYVTINEELKWGGILIKIKDIKRLIKMKLVLKNSTNNYWNIKFKNFYIFYRKNVSKYDKFRELFISKAHLKF